MDKDLANWTWTKYRQVLDVSKELHTNGQRFDKLWTFMLQSFDQHLKKLDKAWTKTKTWTKLGQSLDKSLTIVHKYENNWTKLGH